MSAKPPIQEACASLVRQYRKAPWFVAASVGIYQDVEVIYLYVRTYHFNKDFLRDGWQGYGVVCRRSYVPPART